jgi:hypothetical protein
VDRIRTQPTIGWVNVYERILMEIDAEGNP